MMMCGCFIGIFRNEMNFVTSSQHHHLQRVVTRFLSFLCPLILVFCTNNFHNRIEFDMFEQVIVGIEKVLTKTFQLFVSVSV